MLTFSNGVLLKCTLKIQWTLSLKSGHPWDLSVSWLEGVASFQGSRLEGVASFQGSWLLVAMKNGCLDLWRFGLKGVRISEGLLCSIQIHVEKKSRHQILPFFEEKIPLAKRSQTFPPPSLLNEFPSPWIGSFLYLEISILLTRSLSWSPLVVPWTGKWWGWGRGRASETPPTSWRVQPERRAAPRSGGTPSTATWLAARACSRIPMETLLHGGTTRILSARVMLFVNLSQQQQQQQQQQKQKEKEKRKKRKKFQTPHQRHTAVSSSK